MDLSNYIEQLLYANDCVIIPNIGGFIVNYEAAKIDFVAQELAAPTKEVSFNPKLVSNDGLLANHLAQKEHLDYKKAAEKVAKWSSQIEEDLFNKKIVYFHKIGKLYFNSDSKLEFVPEPTNFLLDVYGLPHIECRPVLRSKEYLKEAVTASAASQATTSTALAPTKNKKALLPLAVSPKLMAAAAVVLLLFSTPYWWGSWSSNDSNTTTAIAAKQDKTTNDTPTTPKSTSTASVFPSSNPTPTPQPSEEKVDTVVVEKIAKEVVVVQENNDNTYVVVLGAFGNKKNATRLAKKLEKDGYLPVIEMTASGLHRVGAEIMCNASEFGTHFSYIKDHYNKKAWVVE